MMYYLAYDENGEVLGIYERGDEEDCPMIAISAEQRSAVLEQPHAYRVVNEILERLEEPSAPEPQVRLSPSMLIAGVLVDGVCYATNVEALSILAVGVSVGKPVAVVHKPTGDEVVKITKETAIKIHKALHKKLTESLSAR